MPCTPLSMAFFSNTESAIALHRTNKHGDEVEHFHAWMSVQIFPKSIFLQSKTSNFGSAESFSSMAGIDSRFGKHVPFRPISSFRNESNSSFCSIFRPTMFTGALGIALGPDCFDILFELMEISKTVSLYSVLDTLDHYSGAIICWICEDHMANFCNDSSIQPDVTDSFF